MNSKICTQCKVSLTIGAFNKAKKGKFGVEAICRKCKKENTRTVTGLVSIIYSEEKRNSKNRGYALPTYSKEWLHDWIISQDNFDALYEDWKQSGYQSKLRPSVDRLNDYESYTEKNIQLVTWEDNKSDGHKARKSGENNKNSVSVVQLSKDGEFIAKYYSQKEAMRQTGIRHTSISNVCYRRVQKNGRGETYVSTLAGGFKWMFETEYKELKKTP